MAEEAAHRHRDFRQEWRHDTRRPPRSARRSCSLCFHCHRI